MHGNTAGRVGDGKIPAGAPMDPSQQLSSAATRSVVAGLIVLGGKLIWPHQGAVVINGLIKSPPLHAQ
eukprot:scaffold625_cov420-Prasinococcus_capsulatus_cf.AAC.22